MERGGRGVGVRRWWLQVVVKLKRVGGVVGGAADCECANTKLVDGILTRIYFMSKDCKLLQKFLFCSP